MTEQLAIFGPSDQVDPTRVRRSKTGRPYVKQSCPADIRLVDNLARREEMEDYPDSCFGGRVAGARPGKSKQCPKCKGKGYVEKLYHRCTSFVGVLEDHTAVEQWRRRVTLVGLGVDHGLLQALAAADPDDRETLDSLADKAFEVGEGHARAQKGTDLHKLTEYVDLGEPLPKVLVDFETGQERPVTLQDRADLAAWHRTVEALNLQIVGIECFVVNDDYEIGGTYDRRTFLMDEICHCLKPVILDLKTGRIDYGAGKIAQQLGVYANSKDYDPATGERTDQDVCTHFGIVVHLPQGGGHATVHVVDLEAGWAAVALSSQVREHRRTSKHMIWPIESHSEVVQ